MKMFTLPVIIAGSILFFSSCNKQYNETIIGANNGSTNPVTGNNSFNWAGTPPLSVKINGTAFATDASTVDVSNMLGYYYVIVEDATGNGVVLTIPTNAIEGKEYSMPSPANITYQFANNGAALGGTSGKYKIVTNNTTTLEGYFWANTKDYTGQQTSETVALTEGYFKVAKP